MDNTEKLKRELIVNEQQISSCQITYLWYLLEHRRLNRDSRATKAARFSRRCLERKKTSNAPYLNQII